MDRKDALRFREMKVVAMEAERLMSRQPFKIIYSQCGMNIANIQYISIRLLHTMSV